MARKYDIRPNLVSRWVRQYKAGQSMQGSSPKGNAPCHPAGTCSTRRREP
ncbi:hypothetical protein [Alicyclobacillus herbarius]